MGRKTRLCLIGRAGIYAAIGALVVMMTAVVTAAPPATASAAVPRPSAAASAAVLRLDFDAPPRGQPAAGPWRQGCFANPASANSACVSVAGGGSIARTSRPTSGGASPAIAFPGRGRAVLRTPPADRLNPDTDDFMISAMVRLTRGQVSSDSNLVQKGYYHTAGGQWKLQVDGGVPSCRIAGTRSGRTASAIVRWHSSIAGQGWTQVRCQRQGAALSISVAGHTPVTARGDARMRIANRSPVTVGGKGTGTDNDQFRGSLDNVVVSIG